MLTTLLMNFGGSILAVLAAVAGAFGLYFAGKQKGKIQAEVKQVQDNAKRDVVAAQAEVITLKEKQNVQTNIDKMPNGSAADKLRNDWSRD